MSIIANIFIGLIALIHLYIMYIEMMAWETKGKKTFKDTLASDLFTPTKALAANLGLYNGFLAAGLIWSLLITNKIWHVYVGAFFLCCIIVAGLYGTFSASKKIFFVQALPAIIALIFLLLS
jgi:putative membrane protein